MRIRRQTRGDCLVVTVAGVLHPATAPAVREAVLKSVVEQPRGVVVDLTELVALDQRCVSLFDTVGRHACEWPGTGIALCGASGDVARTLARAGAPRFLPLFPGLDEAISGVREQPPRQRTQAALSAEPSAACQARSLLRDLCDRWQLEELRDTALVVVGELVTNSVKHASPPFRLRVELGPRALTVAVSDQSTAAPRQWTPDLNAEGGRGLFLIERLAMAWGVHWHADGGKTVWCALRR